MFKKQLFKNLVSKVRDVIALAEEEEIVEEEEEEEYHETVLNDTKEPQNDSDLDLDLAIDTEPKTASSSEHAVLLPYYHAIQKLNGFFPNRDFKKHPSQLAQAIKEMNADIERLTLEQEKLRQESDILREINSKRRGISENESLMQALLAKQKSLERAVQNLEIVNSTMEDSSMDLDSAEKKMVEVQNIFQSQLSDNEQTRREIARLKEHLEMCQEQDANLLKDLEDEKDSYNQLVKQLSTFQAEVQGIRAEEDELEVTRLEEELATANAEWERLRETRIPKEEVEQIEKELAQLTEEYKHLVEEKEMPREAVSEVDNIRNEITELLVRHFSGDKAAIDDLKSKFGWTDEQMAALKEERGGLTGFIKQGAKLFTGFRDAWTSWLIAASED